MNAPTMHRPFDINLNRSNSDCTARKTDRSPFVRLSVERSSMRRKKRPVSWQGLQQYQHMLPFDMGRMELDDLESARLRQVQQCSFPLSSPNIKAP